MVPGADCLQDYETFYQHVSLRVILFCFSEGPAKTLEYVLWLYSMLFATDCFAEPELHIALPRGKVIGH